MKVIRLESRRPSGEWPGHSEEDTPASGGGSPARKAAANRTAGPSWTEKSWAVQDSFGASGGQLRLGRAPASMYARRSGGSWNSGGQRRHRHSSLTVPVAWHNGCAFHGRAKNHATFIAIRSTTVRREARRVPRHWARRVALPDEIPVPHFPSRPAHRKPAVHEAHCKRVCRS